MSRTNKITIVVLVLGVVAIFFLATNRKLTQESQVSKHVTPSELALTESSSATQVEPTSSEVAVTREGSESAQANGEDREPQFGYSSKNDPASLRALYNLDYKATIVSELRLTASDIKYLKVLPGV